MISSRHRVNGKFSTTPNSLPQYCEEILLMFNDSEEIIQAGRNTLKLIHLDEIPCVIKAFRIPKFPQNYSYGLVAKSKAQKSFNNASKLIELGFLSPKPIGYFEYTSMGKIINSYYLCEYESDIQTLDEMLAETPTLNSSLIKQFAEYSYRLHQKGVHHRDFNPKNILINTKANAYTFSLVDINRITWFEKLSLKQSMYSLARLPFNDEVKNELLNHYAKIAKVDLDQCQSLLNSSIAKTERYFRNKKRFRKIFPKRKK